MTCARCARTFFAWTPGRCRWRIRRPIFVFIDPPYSTHLEYSDDPRCIGKLDAAKGEYYEAMDQVIGEIERILRPGRHMAMLVCDSFVKGSGFLPIGFELFALLRKRFEPVDIVAVVRHNKTLEMGNYRAAAERGIFICAGFTYLFIMRKPLPKPPPAHPLARASDTATSRRAAPPDAAAADSSKDSRKQNRSW